MQLCGLSLRLFFFTRGVFCIGPFTCYNRLYNGLYNFTALQLEPIAFRSEMIAEVSQQPILYWISCRTGDKRGRTPFSTRSTRIGKCSLRSVRSHCVVKVADIYAVYVYVHVASGSIRAHTQLLRHCAGVHVEYVIIRAW